MIRYYLPILMALLGGCVSLPGEERTPRSQYSLQPAQQVCSRGDQALALKITRVASGLDTDRVARRDESSGEFSYLKGVRWIDNIDSMLEQRLAADLECQGFVVQTGHRTRLGRSQLHCEVRALNLVQADTQQWAELSLSCLFVSAAEPGDRALLESSRVPLQRWSSSEAMQALNRAYNDVFNALASGLKAPPK